MPPQQYLLIRHHGILGCSIAATAKVTPSRRRMSDCHTCLNICVYVNAKAWKNFVAFQVVSEIIWKSLVPSDCVTAPWLCRRGFKIQLHESCQGRV